MIISIERSAIPAIILLIPIEYQKGVGPQRADLLKKELSIFTFKDLLEYFPFRHIDKTQINKIADIQHTTEYVQVAAKLTQFDVVGEKRGKRLVAYVEDDTGELELVWCQSIHWIQKTLAIGTRYLVFGRTGFFMNHPQITHPEMELMGSEQTGTKNFLEPIYASTEKLKARSLNGRQLGKISYHLFSILTEKEVREILPVALIKKF